jgi:hypothetical protein
VIRDGFLLAPEGPGLGTRLKAGVLERPDAHVEVTTEAADFEPVGFHDPGQRVPNYFSPNVPGES